MRALAAALRRLRRRRGRLGLSTTPKRSFILFGSRCGFAGITRAIRKEDLEAKTPGKSVSVYREPGTSAGELSRRGLALNLQPEWAADPVAARASVLSLRQLIDVLAANWRLVCVNADPMLGACLTHASIVRSDPKPGDKQRMQWLLVQSEVAAAFGQIAHLSGAAVRPI
jgi:hypothetical protein